MGRRKNVDIDSVTYVETLVKFQYAEGGWKAYLLSEPPKDNTPFAIIRIPVPEWLQMPTIRAIVVAPPSQPLKTDLPPT